MPCSCCALTFRRPDIPKGGVENCEDALVVQPRFACTLQPAHETAPQHGMTGQRHRRQCAQDEGALSRPAANQPLVLQLAICLEHCVGIDDKLLDYISHGRQLVAYTEYAQAQSLLDLLHDLQVRRHPGVVIQMKLDHMLLLAFFVLLPYRSAML